ncbi:MAG TPA: hypothetical protein VER11_16540 [Polyangiaceae bacterium]|nr:hypothetical protein [Polyangiaceae bacterium]
MMLKRSTTESKPGAAARLVRAGLAGLAVAGIAAGLATGCLDRPVVPQEPKTSNVFVDQIIQTAVDKIDLLFMIDNSVSMQDKQEILKAAVPVLVGRLVQPICVDAMGKPAKDAQGKFESSTGGSCPKTKGSPEFSPIGDIHIGIVSSSLGAHGGSVCSTGAATDTLDDKARLIPSMRTGIASYNNTGFLAWDASGTKNSPPGESNPDNLNKQFADQIASVGEHGCGYEASLESWYRFLVDPEPPAAVTTATVNGVTQTVRGSQLVIDPATKKVTGCTGCDDTLLAQRKAFLRPDSLVAIIMLSDENDCSIRDDSVGWFVGAQSRMPRSTTPCADNPNSACCRSCAQQEASPPSGCGALADDANCKNTNGGKYAVWEATQDSLNLRCYNQHQRFGFDLLYDTNRYVSALKSTTIALQSTGQVVTNPLYDSAGTGKAPRDPSLVFLAGIVGVPWQDIADDASLNSATALTYLTADELAAMDRWKVLLGDPKPANGGAPVLPSDPFMIETPTVRMGTNPIVNVAIQPPNTNTPNVINGHEQNIPAFDDLQYACTFPLQKPKVCMNGDSACDCSPDKMGKLDAVVAANSPLCQNGQKGEVSATQTSAKAYPGARELQVLKDLGSNAIVASICPKVTTTADPSSDPNYGYNPAVGAIINRLKDALKGKCLPRPIQTDDKGQVLCAVIEAQNTSNGNQCNCALPGRKDVNPKLLGPVRQQLQLTGQCGNGTQGSCDTWCQCEIKQFDDSNGDLTSCQTGQGTSDAGYCYVDKDPGQLAKCPANQQQLLRFMDKDQTKTPVAGAVAFIACLGAPVGSDADAGP